MRQLNGKLAFIRGGSRGMGAAIAARLTSEGANIVFTHSGKHPGHADAILNTIREHNVQGIALIANNEQPGQLLHALEQPLADFGRLDILVNNAGIFTVKPVEKYDLEEYDRFMDVNVKAAFVACQFAARHMNSGGSIITIGGNMAGRVSLLRESLYAMSKSALIGLTKGVASDLVDSQYYSKFSAARSCRHRYEPCQQ